MSLRRVFVRDSSGFSLLELLIVMAILAILIGGGWFLSLDFYRGYIFRAERDLLVQVLIKARNQAMVNLNGSAHGVRIEQGSLILFSGSQYIPGNSQNLVVPANSAIRNGGLQEVVFSQLTGEVESAGDLILTYEGYSTKISLNKEGRIDW